MKLITKIPVSYNDGISGQATSVVIGTLSTCNQQFRAGFKSNFMFEYKTDGGKALTNGMYEVTAEETNTLYEIVKSSLPKNLSYTDTTIYLYYLGMKVKMAETFGITVADIDIV